MLDLQGRRVRAWGEGGAASWDGRDEMGRPMPAGVYLARVTSGAESLMRTLIWLP